MNKNINDFLDSMTQQELEQWEEIPLIAMEDDVVQKRIQKIVKKKLKKTHKNTVAVTVAACFVLFVVFLSEPVRAELERIFHFIPNIGVVESDVVYEVEIICGKLQKDNVTVELKDCYVKGDFLLGTISITDISPYIHKEELFSDENMTIGEQMNEKYTITWYHNGEQRELFFIKSGANLRDNFKQIEKGLHQIIEKSENDYYEIGVNGFEEKLSFRLKETKAISNLNSIGNTVTQYGTSITAKAEMTEKGAKIDYYAICSEEAKTIHQFGEYRSYFDYMPHFETIPNAYYNCYLKTKSGDFAKIITAKNFIENGGEIVFDATEKDFPATFYYTALSAKTEECEFVQIPVPEIGQTIPLDICIPFQYGTVKILSVNHIQTIDYTGVHSLDENGKYYAEKGLTDKLTLNFNIQSNQKERMLYYIDTKVAEGSYYGAHCSTIETTQQNDIFCKTISFSFLEEDFQQEFQNKNEKSIKLQFYEPTYWIGKEYKIPVAIQ